MRRALAALTLLTAHAANIASELEAFVDAAAGAPAQTAAGCRTSANRPVVGPRRLREDLQNGLDDGERVPRADRLRARAARAAPVGKRPLQGRRAAAPRGQGRALRPVVPPPDADARRFEPGPPRAERAVVHDHARARVALHLDDALRAAAGRALPRNAAALVDSIQKKRLPDGDANTFCNNVAWVLSGEQRTLAYGVSREEQLAAATAITARLDAHETLVLMQKDMAASLALLASSLNWDLAASPARLRSARVARGRRGAARCEDAACRNAVLACNVADSQPYETYERRFDAEIARRDGDEQFPREPAGRRRGARAQRAALRVEVPDQLPAAEHGAAGAAAVEAAEFLWGAVSMWFVTVRSCKVGGRRSFHSNC